MRAGVDSVGLADFKRRAAHEYRENGASRAVSWMASELRRAVDQTAEPMRVYWAVSHAMESQPTVRHVGDATARFDTRSRHDYVHVRRLGNEEPIIEDVIQRVRPDDTFWDVGAKIGVYSWLVADRLKDGHVVGYEPNPARSDRWAHNRALNAPDATLLTCALFDDPGAVEMSPGGLNPPAYATDRFLAELRRGDEVIDSGDAPTPDVLKIDVEGAEFQVLKGLSSTLLHDPPRLIYIEVHDKMERFDAEPADLYAYLGGFGYERTYIESDYPEGNTRHFRFEYE